MRVFISLIGPGWCSTPRNSKDTRPVTLMRHPQHDGFILVMLGFLLMWPTLLTLAMFPIPVIVSLRLGRQEEKRVCREFGHAYDRSANEMPAFLPNWKKKMKIQ